MSHMYNIHNVYNMYIECIIRMICITCYVNLYIYIYICISDIHMYRITNSSKAKAAWRQLASLEALCSQPDRGSSGEASASEVARSEKPEPQRRREYELGSQLLVWGSTYIANTNRRAESM